MKNSYDNNNEIKVSVCVLTYNQEKYIRQCLQSIVDQKTDFKFDLIVSDDCSTDGTRAIVQEFAERYPNIVKPILHKKNIGAYKNYFSAHQNATGEYVAHVDGDDYCLPNKLQTQAEFLNRSPKCNIVWHKMHVEMPNGDMIKTDATTSSDLHLMTFDRRAIIKFIAIGANSSKMYRKSVGQFSLPDFEAVDYFANVEQVGDGVACFVGDEPLGVYRMGIGISASGSKTREILASCFMYFHKKYPEYGLEANTAALTYLLMDLKNRRKTWPLFFRVWMKTFKVGSVFSLIKDLKIINQLKVKS